MAKKYFDAEKLKAEIEKLIDDAPNYDDSKAYLLKVCSIIDSLQQERQVPDSTQLIAEWEKEKVMLEQKDVRGDAERMAYNAFLDGFIKGLGYEGTK